MKKIYIILTHTGTFLSNVVKLYTKNEYSHISISLDKDLKRMYSFGRINAYNPFWGGFVHESLEYGTFKRFKKTKSIIYSLEIDDDDYLLIENTIKRIGFDKKSYRFNMIGLMAVVLNRHLKRNKCFYCAEFVKYLFDIINLDLDLPEIVKPSDFQDLNGLSLVYTGFLREYKNNMESAL